MIFRVPKVNLMNGQHHSHMIASYNGVNAYPLYSLVESSQGDRLTCRTEKDKHVKLNDRTSGRCGKLLYRVHVYADGSC